jgi:hypothetical protein
MRRIAAIGTAKKSPACGRPAYHWPRPGQMKDRIAAVAGERDGRRACGRILLGRVVTAARV